MTAETHLIRFAGRVQGVGFRWRTRQEATALHLGGSVRNLHDGSVEVRATGERKAIQELVERLRSAFRVTGLESRQVETEIRESEFKIDID